MGEKKQVRREFQDVFCSFKESSWMFVLMQKKWLNKTLGYWFELV